MATTGANTAAQWNTAAAKTTTDPAVQPATDQTAAETARLNRAPETTTDPNVAQAQATDNNFNDKKTVADEPNVQQAAATDNTFNDKKDAAFYNPAQQAERDAATSAAAPTATGGAANQPDTGSNTTNTNSGLAPKTNAQSQATQQDVSNFKKKEDWRVRLSLSPGAQSAKYLYWSDTPGILVPLQATDGVIFPYTPAISVSYNAHYDTPDLIHSNYKAVQYKNSSVDQITISCDFTAQDTTEANYLLAVIHFFKSVTKMFYGQDNQPKNGTPPPLCYLSGLGDFQFDAHPLAITSFNYTLPVDVDYIRAGSALTQPGTSAPAYAPPNTAFGQDPASQRMAGAALSPGAVTASPKFSTASAKTAATYVPTKMQIQITAMPVVTRNDISNNFSLKKYASGELLQGTKRQGGGIW